MTKLVGKAKARARAKSKQQQSLKPTFYEMIHDVASGTSGNNEQNKLAATMMMQAFVIPGTDIWTNTTITKDYNGLCVTADHYQNFIEWYADQKGIGIGGGKEAMPFVPIRGNIKLYNHIRTDKLIDADTDGWKLQETMMHSMNYWLNNLCTNDPEWPLLQYTVLVNQDLFGTAQHKQSTHQATIVNLGPIRLVMLEDKHQHTQLTIKENPDWEEYCGKHNIKH